MCYIQILVIIALVGASVIERPRVRSYSPFSKITLQGKAYADLVKPQNQNQSPVVVPSWSAAVVPKKNYSPFKSVKPIQAQAQIAPVAVPVVASVAVASSGRSAIAESAAPKKNYSPFKSVQAIQAQAQIAPVAVASSGRSAVAEFAASAKKSYSPYKSVRAQAQARPTAYVAPDLMNSLRAAPSTVTPAASIATRPSSSFFSLLAQQVSGIVRMLKMAASVVAAVFFGKRKAGLAV